MRNLAARCAALVVTTAIVSSCSTGDDPFPLPAGLVPPPATLAFPTHEPLSGYPSALLLGRLVERDGCLIVVRPRYQYETLLIWPDTMRPATDGDGRVVVVGEDGTMTAVVGERVRGGGGEVPLAHLETLGARVPDRCRGGPYWLLGDISLAQGDVEDRTTAAERAPRVAHVACHRDAARLQDALVRASEEGVHIAFSNPGEAWGFELHAEGWGHGEAVFDNFRPYATKGTYPSAFSLPPGRVTVACLPHGKAAYYDPRTPVATLTVVDPDELYVPSELSCGDGRQFRATITASTDEDPRRVFERLDGVEPSDLLRKPGYPGSPQHWPTYVLFREGEALARLTALDSAGREWELFVNACPGSGI